MTPVKQKPFPQPPANIAPYVEILGPELTIEFLLTFGGAELYIAAKPGGRSRLEALVGRKRAAALGSVAHRLQSRVPLAKPWTAVCLKRQGHSVNEIARRLHTADVTVRRWLKKAAQE